MFIAELLRMMIVSVAVGDATV